MKGFKDLCEIYSMLRYHIAPHCQVYDKFINHVAIYAARCIKEYLKDEKLLNREVEKAIDTMISNWISEPDSISTIFSINVGRDDNE